MTKKLWLIYLTHFDTHTDTRQHLIHKFALFFLFGSDTDLDRGPGLES